MDCSPAPANFAPRNPLKPLESLENNAGHSDDPGLLLACSDSLALCRLNCSQLPKLSDRHQLGLEDITLKTLHTCGNANSRLKYWSAIECVCTCQAQQSQFTNQFNLMLLNVKRLSDCVQDHAAADSNSPSALPLSNCASKCVTVEHTVALAQPSAIGWPAMITP